MSIAPVMPVPVQREANEEEPKFVGVVVVVVVVLVMLQVQVVVREVSGCLFAVTVHNLVDEDVVGVEVHA
jgi:hypothetical protein